MTQRGAVDRIVHGEGGVRLGAALALALAAAAAILAGAAAGAGRGAVIVVVGAALIVVGARRAAEPDPISRAVGSVALVSGGVLVVPPIATADRLPVVGLLACAALGVFVVGFVTASGSDPGSREAPLYALFTAVVVTFVGGVLLIALATVSNAALSTVASARLAPGSVAGGNVLLALLVLQVEVITTSVVLGYALSVLERWLPRRESPGISAIDRLAVDVNDLRPALLLFLLLQAGLSASVGLSTFLRTVLVATPPGAVVYAALTSGIVHLLLAAVLALLFAVLLLEVFRRVVVSVADPHPPTVLANAAGGVLLTALVVVLAAVSPGLLTTVLGESIVSVDGVSLATLALWTVAGRVVAVLVALGIASWLLTLSTERTDIAALAGVGLLVATAALGSEAGAHPVAVFTAVGLALLAGDVGIRSLDLARTLGHRGDTGSVELVGAVGNAVALVIGVVAATAALYVVVPATRGLASSRGALLVLSALVALLAFLLLLGRESPAPE